MKADADREGGEAYAAIVPADHAQRQRALDIHASFIVRAPAGSGKTRLLIQRYLALLATVDEPEEVIAITFTRKAAAEMRARVVSAFLSAGDETESADHETQQLAKRALARDHARGWQLVANTSRLRIQTIDSMNASLTRQMPILSRFGAQPESADDASALYLQAAKSMLEQINDGDDVADDLATLLTHLDNNLGVVEQLVADMLRSRDHWLRNLPNMHEREALESALMRVRARAAVAISAVFPMRENAETLELVRFSGRNLLKDAEIRPLSDFANATIFPDADANDVPAWLAIADLLLTKEGTWRKPRGIDKRMGFPTSADKKEKARLDAMKDRLRALLERLTADARADALLAALDSLRALPPNHYTDSAWQVLGAIVRLLPHATAHLWNVFGHEAQCDFTEIAQAASRALGEADTPTDLALALDYRIRHLLVDEFQDTSFTQFELLEKLTRGWGEGEGESVGEGERDGRTLFVVGDPMQSIYRFREAEVGLFLRAQQFGIGRVSLTPLTLSVNFRSTAGVVDWVNQTFSQLMASTADVSAGAVPYSASVAFVGGEQGEGSEGSEAVTVHWTGQHKNSDEVPAEISSPARGRGWPPGQERGMVQHRDVTRLQEAQNIITIIQQTKAETPQATIAILVRNRTHLADIIPALKAANIAFHAVDIDALKDRPVVQDLLALTRAVTHLADRIAWLAVLRAPWCGLTLNDLAALTASVTSVDGVLAPDARTVFEMIHDELRVNLLCVDGQACLNKFREVIDLALQTRSKQPLRDVVESSWLALHGPACLRDPEDLNDAYTFLDLLEQEAELQAASTQIIDLNALESRMDRLFSGGRVAAASDHDANAPVQIMTIHKAKGLEFDTVIVPGLHRPPRHDDKKLLVWTEQPNVESGEREILLAPIRETGGDEEADAIYQYIVGLDRAKQQHEDVRLLYVAATRAERKLHLLATLNIKDADDEKTITPPKSASLLASLWPALNLDEAALIEQASSSILPSAEEATTSNMPETRHSTRLSRHLFIPVMPTAVSTNTSAIELRADKNTPNTAIDFEWASDTARHVGTVVHAFLQRMAEGGAKAWTTERIASASTRTLIEVQLATLGVANEELANASTRIQYALSQTLEDPRGQWALKAYHDAKSEWRLTGMIENVLTNVTIDRTFVDEHGTRWIIDFKTGDHKGADVEAFLDNEVKRYRGQLETYAMLVGAMECDANPIKLGLYFPLLGGWRAWDFVKNL